MMAATLLHRKLAAPARSRWPSRAWRRFARSGGARRTRWLRQGFAVHLFCNNEGERQRFGEIWEEYGLGAPAGASGLPQPQPSASLEPDKRAGLDCSVARVDRPAAAPVLHL